MKHNEASARMLDRRRHSRKTNIFCVLYRAGTITRIGALDIQQKQHKLARVRTTREGEFEEE